MNNREQEIAEELARGDWAAAQSMIDPDFHRHIQKTIARTIIEHDKAWRQALNRVNPNRVNFARNFDETIRRTPNQPKPFPIPEAATSPWKPEDGYMVERLVNKAHKAVHGRTDPNTVLDIPNYNSINS